MVARIRRINVLLLLFIASFLRFLYCFSFLRFPPLQTKLPFPACREVPLYLTLCHTIPTNHFHPPFLFFLSFFSDPLNPLQLSYSILSPRIRFLFLSALLLFHLLFYHSQKFLLAHSTPLSLLVNYSFSTTSFWGSGFVGF